MLRPPLFFPFLPPPFLSPPPPFFHDSVLGTSPLPPLFPPFFGERPQIADLPGENSCTMTGAAGAPHISAVIAIGFSNRGFGSLAIGRAGAVAGSESGASRWRARTPGAGRVRAEDVASFFFPCNRFEYRTGRQTLPHAFGRRSRRLTETLMYAPTFPSTPP